MKSLFPKRLLSTFDVFEKTEKIRIEAFLANISANFTFWDLQTYSLLKIKKCEKFTIFSLGFSLVYLNLKKWMQGVLELNIIKFWEILFHLE